VREIAARGHEVASHGWDHTLVTALDPRRFREDVRSARCALEQAAGAAVVGYRAPNYSIGAATPWAFPILLEEGHAYDSSIVPIVHDRYGAPSAPRFPHVAFRSDGLTLWEVPVGTVRVAGVNVPIGGGFFRLLPGVLVRAGVRRVNRTEGRPTVLYVHPWEFDPDQPRLAMRPAHRLRHYVGLARAGAKLATLLTAFAFTSIARAFPALPAAGRADAALAPA
jgi:polysaccharide deacetylase family protein (PEP-CTERM system associated)